MNPGRRFRPAVDPVEPRLAPSGWSPLTIWGDILGLNHHHHHPTASHAAPASAPHPAANAWGALHPHRAG